MATRPSETFEFATNDKTSIEVVDGSPEVLSNKEDIPVAIQQDGFKYKQGLAFNYLNTLFNKIAGWINYLDQRQGIKIKEGSTTLTTTATEVSELTLTNIPANKVVKFTYVLQTLTGQGSSFDTAYSFTISGTSPTIKGLSSSGMNGGNNSENKSFGSISGNQHSYSFSTPNNTIGSLIITGVAVNVESLALNLRKITSNSVNAADVTLEYQIGDLL